MMQRNLLKSVLIASSSSTLACVLFHYATNTSPLPGYWFVAYTLITFFVSLVLSVKIIQWFLHLNKPLKYDVQGVITRYPILSFLGLALPTIPKTAETVEWKEYDTNELSVITSVLERKLVSSWYIHFISQEIGFPFACKQMLDQMISKAFQICNKIETKDVYVHLCAILISHLKEYKKAVKRHEKTPEKSIEVLYKKVHPAWDPSNLKTASADHCVKLIRVILKELVPWELWDTPHSELLVRIIARKLDAFIDTTIADPVWLNDKLLSMLLAQESAETTKVETEVTVRENNLSKEKVEDLNPELLNKEQMYEVKAIKKDEFHVVKENDKCFEAIEMMARSEPVEIKPMLRQRRGRQGRNEVKIYDRVIEGSVKTWETDMDLQCISMGQDLLASLDELTLSRLWGHEDIDPSPKAQGSSALQPLWFGEEEAMELEAEAGHSAKAGELLKDLQSTVTQAKSRIGDLQVAPHLARPDEAAGMMEGLLDKGLAGLKKGLRLTGLSDDSQEKSPAHPRQDRERTSPDMRVHPAAKEDAGSVPPLVKQPRVSSQDSVIGSGRARLERPTPPESPEPQYEEAADLSQSIAKLRSLLNETAPRSEVWWESAEETRGRSASQLGERVDAAALADEYDMGLERTASPGQGNNMQRLDKLFQRTVTGVFNSLKTAVGAEGDGEPPPNTWTYVPCTMDTSVGSAVSRLVGSRRALAHVDAAFDSLQQLPAPAQAPPSDDFEEWSTGEARWSATGELLCELGLCSDHVTFRLATILLADVAERLICSWLEELTAWLRRQLFSAFERMAESASEPAPGPSPRPHDVRETCRVVMGCIPETYVFGEERMAAAVRLLAESASHKSVVRDVQMRALDVLAAHFTRSAVSLPSAAHS